MKKVFFPLFHIFWCVWIEIPESSNIEHFYTQACPIPHFFALTKIEKEDALFAWNYGDILLDGHQQNIKVEVEIKDTCIGVSTFKSQSKIEG